MGICFYINNHTTRETFDLNKGPNNWDAIRETVERLSGKNISKADWQAALEIDIRKEEWNPLLDLKPYRKLVANRLRDFAPFGSFLSVTSDLEDEERFPITADRFVRD